MFLQFTEVGETLLSRPQAAGHRSTPIPQIAAPPASSAFSIHSLIPQKLKLSTQFSRSNRRGGAIVEFAVVAPLLFFLILGMIEFGRLMMVQQMLTNAAREGARRAVLASTTSDTTVTDVIDPYLAAGGVAGHTTTITKPAGWTSLNAGDPITVEVKIRYGLVSLVGDAGLAAMSGEMFGVDYGTVGGLRNKDLKATSIMAREASSD